MSASPIGPWRWMIFLSRMGACFISLGLFKSMSVFVPEFVDYFHTTTSAAGLVCSIPYSVGITAGVFTGVLLMAWPARPLMILGGAISVVGFIGAVSSQKLFYLAVWLTFASFGHSVIMMASLTSLLLYFPDNFASVNGITLAGGAAGTMVLPPLTELLLKSYGWKGALVILGAISAHFCVFGALVRPLHSQYTYTTINKSSAIKSTKEPERDNKTKQALKMWNALKDKLDFQLFVDEPRFIITQLVSTLCGIVYTGWHLYLIPHGIALGFGEIQSSFLATFGGLGAIIGRLSHGTFVDRGVIQATDLFAVSSIVLAVACVLDQLASSYFIAIATLATIAGFALGIVYPLLFVMAVDVPQERQVSALALMYLFQGTGLISGSFLCGWIHDITSDYEVVFTTLGGISLVMGAMSMAQRLMSACCPRTTQD